MSEQKHNAPKTFPKDWEFKRCLENAESYLDAICVGGTYKPRNPDVMSPFSVIDLVDDLMRKFSRQNRPEDLYGTLYVRMRNDWYDHYEPRVSTEFKNRLPSAPSEKF